jgi:hypothetical protein
LLTDLRTLTPAQRWGLKLKAQLDNAIGRVDYPYFVGDILGYRKIANDPRNPGNFEQFNDPRVQQNLAAVGEYFEDWRRNRHKQTSFRKVLIVQPRGTCKSATATIPLPLWAHIHDSELASCIISAVKEKMAEDFAKATKATFEGEDPFSRLVDLYGTFKPQGRGRDWQNTKMVTAKRNNVGRSDPTYAAYTITAGPTGGHFDVVIVDDPITRDKMQSDSEWLEKVWAAYTRLPYTINRNGLLMVVMTRYHDNDLCGRVIREEIEPAVLAEYENRLPEDFDYEYGWIKYAHLAGWEVRYDTVYNDYDPDTREGEVVYPVCWSHEKIKHSRQTALGEAEFWYHLMNAPQKREDQPITEEMIRRCWIDSLDEVPAQAFNAIDIHCDFSFKNEEAFRKQTGDWGVAHVIAKHNGHVYRIGGMRGKLRQTDFGDQLMKLVSEVYYAHKSRVRYISFDQPSTHGSGDESTNEWIYSLFRAHPDLPRAAPKPINRKHGAGAKKVGRILDTLWPWSDGFVHLLRGAHGNDELIYQVLNIGTSPYDDDIDAFCDAFHKDMYQAAPLYANDEHEDDWSQVWKPAIMVEGEYDPWDDDLGA